jgi:hypothetical protein
MSKRIDWDEEQAEFMRNKFMRYARSINDFENTRHVDQTEDQYLTSHQACLTIDDQLFLNTFHHNVFLEYVFEDCDAITKDLFQTPTPPNDEPDWDEVERKFWDFIDEFNNHIC